MAPFPAWTLLPSSGHSHLQLPLFPVQHRLSCKRRKDRYKHKIAGCPRDKELRARSNGEWTMSVLVPWWLRAPEAGGKARWFRLCSYFTVNSAEPQVVWTAGSASSWKKERFQIPFCFESVFRIHMHHTFLLPLEAKELVPGPISRQRQTEDETLSSFLLSNTIPTCWDQISTTISYKLHSVKLFFLKQGAHKNLKYGPTNHNAIFTI